MWSILELSWMINSETMMICQNTYETYLAIEEIIIFHYLKIPEHALKIKKPFLDLGRPTKITKLSLRVII